MRAPVDILYEISEYHERIYEINDKISRLNSDMSTKFSEIDELKAERDHEQAKVLEFENQISSLESEYESALNDRGMSVYD